MRRKFINAICLLLVSCVAVFCGATVALATAPAPPAYFWLTFDRAPQGVQLLECETLLCEQPRLLVQNGICRDADCFSQQPLIQSSKQFQCAEKTCLYQEPPSNARSGVLYLSLIAQFSDRVRSSPPFMTDFRSAIAGYAERHFIVNTRIAALTVRRDQTMQPSRWELFSRALLITQVSKLLVATAVLSWQKAPRAFLTQTLVAIGLINFFTFPVVWFFFPSLQPFQYATTRVFGVSSLLVAIAFSCFLVTRQTITLKTLIRTFIVWILLLPVVLTIAFIAAFIIGYRESLPSAIGISRLITLPASESFAITWEAWLIYRISKNALSIRQVALLSVLTNAVSLILRLMLVPMIVP